jgi:hypothetical protein
LCMRVVARMGHLGVDKSYRLQNEKGYSDIRKKCH